MTIAVGMQSCVWPVSAAISRLLALMWFARWVLINSVGSTSRDPKKVFPPRRPTDQHHAISTSATRDAFYGADFVKGVPQGSYPFSRPPVSLFDLATVSSSRPTRV